MKNKETSRCGKVLGGIRSILLTEKNNLIPPSLDRTNGRYCAAAFVDERWVVSCPFAEGGAEYREQWQAPGCIFSLANKINCSFRFEIV